MHLRSIDLMLRSMKTATWNPSTRTYSLELLPKISNPTCVQAMAMNWTPSFALCIRPPRWWSTASHRFGLGSQIYNCRRPGPSSISSSRGSVRRAFRGGRAPNLDVLLSGSNGIVAIESKLTEYLGPHRAEFSPAYADQIIDERRDQGYFREMIRLEEDPASYA